jgi:hypothetical protein
MHKFAIAAAAIALAPFAAQAQDHSAHAGHADHAAHAKADGKLTLDTPVEAIVAKPEGKAVLEANLPGITTHEHYEMFKAMNLKQIAGMAPTQVTPEVLAKIEVGLATLK